MPLPIEITSASFEKEDAGVGLHCRISHPGAQHGILTIEIAIIDSDGKPIRASASAPRDFIDGNGHIVWREPRDRSVAKETTFETYIFLPSSCGLPVEIPWKAVITVGIGFLKARKTVQGVMLAERKPQPQATAVHVSQSTSNLSPQIQPALASVKPRPHGASPAPKKPSAGEGNPKGICGAVANLSGIILIVIGSIVASLLTMIAWNAAVHLNAPGLRDIGKIDDAACVIIVGLLVVISFISGMISDSLLIPIIPLSALTGARRLLYVGIWGGVRFIWKFIGGIISLIFIVAVSLFVPMIMMENSVSPVAVIILILICFIIIGALSKPSRLAKEGVVRTGRGGDRFFYFLGAAVAGYCAFIASNDGREGPAIALGVLAVAQAGQVFGLPTMDLLFALFSSAFGILATIAIGGLIFYTIANLPDPSDLRSEHNNAGIMIVLLIAAIGYSSSNKKREEEARSHAAALKAAGKAVEAAESFARQYPNGWIPIAFIIALLMMKK